MPQFSYQIPGNLDTQKLRVAPLMVLMTVHAQSISQQPVKIGSAGGSNKINLKLYRMLTARSMEPVPSLPLEQLVAPLRK